MNDIIAMASTSGIVGALTGILGSWLTKYENRKTAKLQFEHDEKMAGINSTKPAPKENEAFVELAQQVREMTQYARDHAVTIAVMGCRVNGPGETDDADLGLWCGPKQVNLKRGSRSLGAFPYDQILDRLKSELDELISDRSAMSGT